MLGTGTRDEWTRPAGLGGALWSSTLTEARPGPGLWSGIGTTHLLWACWTWQRPWSRTAA